jgi:hypothetical protein
MFENIFMIKKIGVGVDAVSANETSGLQSRVKVMAMSYTKDNASCSPTSALENKQMLSHLGEELEESGLMDSDTYSYSREVSLGTRRHTNLVGRNHNNGKRDGDGRELILSGEQRFSESDSPTSIITDGSRCSYS